MTTRVQRAFPVAGSTDRVVLFSWSTMTEKRARNVARLDRHGNVVWRAELPGHAEHDCFNVLQREGDCFVARTYSERVVRMTEDGQILSTEREPSAAFA